jgi:hypothetical protein
MNKSHKTYNSAYNNNETECSSNIIKLERVDQEFADIDQLRDFISDMAFDLASMAKQGGMTGAAQMLSLAALEIGLHQIRSVRS